MDAKRRKMEEKEAQKEAKQAERKRKQEEKEEEKRRKKEEREAGRRKTKEESLGEITVVMDAMWARGGEEGEEIVAFLVGRGVQTRMEEAAVANSIVWMRNKNDASEIEENHLLVKLEAKELSDLVLAGTLLNFAKEISQRYPKKRLAFLVQGLESYLKQQTNDAAKDYRKMVQGRMEGREYSGGGGGGQRITKAKVDEALVWLQIEANCNIKITNSILETADYLFRLSAAIAYTPYRPQSAFENFCAEAVRKKSSGKNMEEIWIAQLEQINGVSNNVAKSIVSQYPSIKSLTDVYLYSNLSVAEKELLLQDIRIESVTSTGRRLGAALSKKIYQVFTVDDPSAIIH